MHAHSGLDATWVDYVLYIDSYGVTGQLMEYSILTLSNCPGQ